VKRTLTYTGRSFSRQRLKKPEALEKEPGLQLHNTSFEETDPKHPRISVADAKADARVRACVERSRHLRLLSAVL